MQNTDPQAIWSDYYLRKKAQRIEEASRLWQLAQDADVKDETVLAIDFVHFGSSSDELEELSKQLSENYEMQVVQAEEAGYWLAKGTTRPYGITLTKEQHMSWVEFMIDVAHSYACVFSTWSLEASSLGIHLRSEQVEIAS